MTGPATLLWTTTAALHAATRRHVDAQVTANLGDKVSRAGDTLTGLLTLSGAPTAALHAATRQYVDAQVTANQGDKVNRVGDTMTGVLNIIVSAATNAWTLSGGL